jgi:hypothetical protein
MSERNKRILEGRRRENKDKYSLYYAKNDHLNFSKFGKFYDFIDDEQRYYRIAYKISPSSINQSRRANKRKCIKGNNYTIKLWVKLPRKEIKWFSSSQRNGYILITLYDRSKTPYIVSLSYTYRGGPNRRTGYVYVRGLTEKICNEKLEKQ